MINYFIRVKSEGMPVRAQVEVLQQAGLLSKPVNLRARGSRTFVNK